MSASRTGARAATALGATALALAALAAPAAAVAPSPSGPRAASATALLLFLAPPVGSAASRRARGARACEPCDDDAALAQLRSVPGLSLGILSATEGVYRAEQLLLDIGAGDRVEYASYRPSRPPSLELRRVGVGGTFAGWTAVLARARAAPQLISPGALASSIPGGAAYAGVAGEPPTDAIAAADATGRVAVWSDGPPSTLPARVADLLARHPFVVADLPSGRSGTTELRAIVAARPATELLIVVQRAPDRPQALLSIGVAGLGAGRELTSNTTEQRGLVSGIDLPVSILEQLGRPIPATMRGTPIRTDGSLHAASLRALRERLLAVAARRLPLLLWLSIVSALLVLLTLGIGRGRAGVRVVALAWMWLPTTQLVPAALAWSAPAEIALIIATSLLLAALTDRLAPWPRAPLLPAVVGVGALTIDALAGTQLLIRSVLGPNPAFGARFYGIGNELKSGLAALTFGGVAAALTRPGGTSRVGDARRAAATMAAAGILLAVIEGSARVGAGVGGVLLVGAGAAVATVCLLPGAINRRRLAAIVAAPLAGLVVLAGLDVVFAHGSGHFSGSVLHARSAGDLRDLLVRRYTDAWDASKDGLMPEAGLAALLAIAAGLRWQRWLLAPLGPADGDTAELWSAALAGGLTAGVVGTLVEDSGTLLLLVAVIALATLVAYVRAAPAGRDAHTASPSRRDRPPAVRMRESADATNRRRVAAVRGSEQ